MSERVDAIMAKVSGAEPKPRDYAGDVERGILMQTFNWYSYEKDRKDAVAYVRAWLKKNDARRVKDWDAINANEFVLTYGWMARMLLQGSTFSEDFMQRFRDHLDRCMSRPVKVEAVADPEPVVKRSIQDSMAERQAEFLGDLEGELDGFILNGYVNSGFDFFRRCQAGNIPRQYMAAAIDLCRGRLAELNAMDTDEQLREGYGHLKKRQITALIKWYDQVIQDADRYANFKKANRKIRVKKAKPAGEQVAKIKHCAEFAELGLKSVLPASIVGAQQLWVYNTKTRRLGVYHAVGPTGFSVKGTSLQGWDPEQSRQRTLRKPADTIPKVLTAGKIALRRILTDLSTTETALTGRINEDTILLRSL